MNRTTAMLRVLARRRRTAGDTATRWTAFARARRAQYGRTAAPRRSPGMALPVGQHGAVVSVQQRWEHAAWTLAPQIHLAIAPLRTERVWHRAALSPVRTILRQGAGLASPLAAAPLRQLVMRRAADRDAPSRLVLLPTGATSLLPMQRAFARQAAEPGRNTTVTHDLRLTTRERVRLVQRVMEERRRVEERSYLRPARAGAPTRSAPNALPTSVVAASGAARRDADPVRRDDARAAAAGAALPPLASPVLDLGVLTEQVVREIDHRIVAQRERLGLFG